MSGLWGDEPWEVAYQHHLHEARLEARAIVRDGLMRKGLMPKLAPASPELTGPARQRARALLTLDVIRLGVEGRLTLKGHLLSDEGVTTVRGGEPVMLSNAKIVRAAMRAMQGEVQARGRR